MPQADYDEIKRRLTAAPERPRPGRSNHTAAHDDRLWAYLEWLEQALVYQFARTDDLTRQLEAATTRIDRLYRVLADINRIVADTERPR